MFIRNQRGLGHPSRRKLGIISCVAPGSPPISDWMLGLGYMLHGPAQSALGVSAYIATLGGLVAGSGTLQAFPT